MKSEKPDVAVRTGMGLLIGAAYNENAAALFAAAEQLACSCRSLLEIMRSLPPDRLLDAHRFEMARAAALLKSIGK